MKIGITGSSRGIGYSISKRFKEQGHTVIGFNISEGWDISDKSIQNKIVESVKDCDLFINNAHSGFSQVDLLFKLHENWQGQKKIIANIGSSITMRWDKWNRDPKYRNEKIALDDACDFLWNKDPWPHIMIFKPCATDTDRMSHWKGNKADPNDIADFLIYCINEKKFRIQQVGIAINPGISPENN